MNRLQGFVRYASAAAAIGQPLGVDPALDCGLFHGRIMLQFRRLGAWTWSEEQRIDYALRAVAVARVVLANDAKRAVRRRSTRAIVVVYEDAMIARGCDVVARWECVVPTGVGEQPSNRFA
jgi:hypothetical protein